MKRLNRKLRVLRNIREHEVNLNPSLQLSKEYRWVKERMRLLKKRTRSVDRKIKEVFKV